MLNFEIGIKKKNLLLIFSFISIQNKWNLDIQIPHLNFATQYKNRKKPVIIIIKIWI